MPDAGGARRAAAPAVRIFTPSGLSAALRTARGPDLGTVVCVHGALDGAASFARVRRRLPGADVVVYDRRGYRSSRSLGLTPGLDVHVDDAIDVLAAARGSGGRPPALVLGHSFGGLVALGVAARRPSGLDGVVVYEPPVPWLLEPEDARADPIGTAPAAAAETFFRRIMGDRAWERLGPAEQAARRLDGPALLEDLAVVRGPAAVDLADIDLPIVIGVSAGAPRRRHAAAVRLSAAVRTATLVRFDDAGHGAHLSHPDQLAALVRTALLGAAAG